MDDLVYEADHAEEHFISYVTPDDKLAGFLRLSLPDPEAPQTNLADLDGAALVREVHVYGQSLAVGAEKHGAAQHAGLGTRLLQRAAEIARVNGFARLAVISAVGTREYYLERGFERGELYMLQTPATGPLMTVRLLAATGREFRRLIGIGASVPWGGVRTCSQACNSRSSTDDTLGVQRSIAAGTAECLEAPLGALRRWLTEPPSRLMRPASPACIFSPTPQSLHVSLPGPVRQEHRLRPHSSAFQRR